MALTASLIFLISLLSSSQVRSSVLVSNNLNVTGSFTAVDGDFQNVTIADVCTVS